MKEKEINMHIYVIYLEFEQVTEVMMHLATYKTLEVKSKIFSFCLWWFTNQPLKLSFVIFIGQFLSLGTVA